MHQPVSLPTLYKHKGYFCTTHKILPPIQTMATPITLQFTSTSVAPILSLMGVL